MFWYTKSNAEHDKIKTPDFQIPVIYICEEKVYLWTYDIEFSGYILMVRSMLAFLEVPQLTTSLTTLTTLFSKNSHTLIYMK